MELKQIATIHTDFPEKFGIPRQSGLVGQLKGQIILEPAYRNREAFRGLAEYSHIWVLWEFSQAKREKWSPTVKPPRLGGNKRMGVFATRSPFRPNPIGLSALKLDSIEYHKTYGPVLHVSGVDMLDGTPVYDIKPYLPYADSYPDATDGFAGRVRGNRIGQYSGRDADKDRRERTGYNQAASFAGSAYRLCTGCRKNLGTFLSAV